MIRPAGDGQWRAWLPAQGLCSPGLESGQRLPFPDARGGAGSPHTGGVTRECRGLGDPWFSPGRLSCLLACVLPVLSSQGCVCVCVKGSPKTQPC